MKKLMIWFYVNKKPISGLLALILYFLDSLFKLSEKLCLPESWYYTFVTFLFLIIGYTINGNGFKRIKYCENKKDDQEH